MIIVWGARARQITAKGHAKQAWQIVNIDVDNLQYQVARGHPVTLLFLGEAHCAVNRSKIDKAYRWRRTIDGVKQRHRLNSVRKRHKVYKISMSFYAMAGKELRAG